MKTCTRCGVEKPLSEFKKDNGYADGYRHQCKPCRNAKERERWANKSPEKAEHHRKRVARWRKENPERDRANSRAAYARDPERHRAYGRKWDENNPAKNRAKWARRRAAKLERTPPWLTDEQHWMIEEVYELSRLRSGMTGVEHHVDHIAPLQGDLVSGLHVPWNLQVIPAADNIRKKNRWQI